MLAGALTWAVNAEGQSSLHVAAPALPIVEVVADSGHTLALLLSGDGGWSGGDRALAQGLASRGVAVIGLDMRAYLRSAQRTPESMSRDTETLVERYGAAWHRDRLVLVGYSRGANVAPFLVNRWPSAVRGRLALLALIGFTDHASFQFHWRDILYDVRRPSDLPTRPELEHVRGATVLCVYGDGEKDSLCPSLNSSEVRLARHSGGHVLDAKSGAEVANLVANSLR